MAEEHSTRSADRRCRLKQSVTKPLTAPCNSRADTDPAKEPVMKRFYSKRLILAVLAGFGAALLPQSGANAQAYRHAPPPHDRTVIVDRGPGRARVVVIDRSRPGWWRGRPGFVGYAGPRPGYYFAPGYGYYVIPRGYVGRPFVAGVVLPPPMRTYVVVSPAMYGLAPAPVGYSWYYAGTGMVLVAISTGIIVQSVAGGW